MISFLGHSFSLNQADYAYVYIFFPHCTLFLVAMHVSFGMSGAAYILKFSLDERILCVCENEQQLC